MTLKFTNAVINGTTITFTIPESTAEHSSVSIVTTISHPGGATFRPVISGTHAHLFTVRHDKYIVFRGMLQDFEAGAQTFSINIQVSVEDDAGNITSHSYTASIVTTDVDEKPSGITVTAVKTELDEGVYEQAVKLADIAIIDDALGTNTLVPLPEDSLFEYRNVTNSGAELWLKAGSALDYETLQSVTASIGVTGTGRNKNPADTTFELQVNNIVENNDTIIVQQADAFTGKVLGKVSLSGQVFVLKGSSPIISSNFAVQNGQLVIINDITNSNQENFNLILFNGHQAQTITVSLNQEPSFPDPSLSIYEGKTLTHHSDQLDLDEDGDTLTYVDRVTTGTRYGSYQIVGGVLTYTPLPGFTGEDYLFVDVTDSRGGVATGVLYVNVKSAIAYKGSLNAVEDSPYHDPSGQASIADPDRPVDEYTLSLNGTSVTTDGTVIAGTYGTFTVNKDGTLSYALDNSNPTVEALDGDRDDTDGAINKLTETVTITYTRLDDPSTPDINEADTITETYDISIRGLTDYYGRLRYNDAFYATGDAISLHQGELRGYMFGGIGDDVLTGGDKRDFLYGKGGDDILYGGENDDLLVGFSGHFDDEGSDILLGGAGDDKFSAGHDDVVDGGTGSDLLLIRYLRNTNFEIRFDPTGDTTRWGKDSEGNWVTGTGDGYDFQRFYFDQNGDGLENEGDFHFFYKNIESFIFRASLGDDTVIGGAGDDKLSGGTGNDIVIGGAGDDFLTARHNDIIDGGADTDTLEIVSRFTRDDVTFDPTADTRLWGKDSEGNWVSGTGEGFEYTRLHIEGRLETTVYHKNIEDFYFRSWHGNDTIVGSSGGDFLAGGRGNDQVSGHDGNDRLWGNQGNDIITGGKGYDVILAGTGADIIVIGPNQTANDTDVIQDFSVIDKIRIDTANGDETTLEALKSAANLRWTNDSNHSFKLGVFTNARRINDTKIYDTRGTASEADDIMLVVLEDFTTELTINNFDIV